MGNSDAPNLRVAEAEEESSIWLVEEKACDVLFANKSDDQPGQVKEETWMWALGVEREPRVQMRHLLGPGTHRSDQ